ncbi:hypothetical protein FACS189491_04220 [Spirochaetia bacterium]|nr:hypothetical protein FACS189491_04220 [Spirochaetia bacterium]
MTILEFNKKFSTEAAAIDHFLKIRYQGIVTCPHCGNSAHIYRYKNGGKIIPNIKKR